jgi:hypothetical protein
LAADPSVVARWRSALPAHGDRLSVGFSWRGGTVKTRRDQRSLVLEQLRPILTRDDCTFVSLQYGDVSEEIETFNATLDKKIIHFPKDSIDDFEDLAGLIGALDIVVSVQNATVHLCGALGKPCLAMLPWKPEWRYGKYGSQMPWYSSVELLRQSQSGDWDSVLAAVESRLSSEIARKQSA